MLRYLRALVSRSRRDRESREELRIHVEMYVEEQVRAGVPEGEARRRARIELGDVDSAAEGVADVRAGAALDALGQDLRQTVRGLARAPGFAAVCTLLVALGVGASTAMFAIVDGALVRPLPFPAPDRMVRLFETSPERGVARTGAARASLAAWRAQSRAFEGLALAYAMGRTISDGAEAEVVIAAQVTCDFFAVLGVPAAHGRTFTAEECRRATFSSAAAPVGPDPVVVLGHGLWLRRFGGDPGVVGRPILIERRAFRVIGVLPSDPGLPEAGVEAYIAWELDEELSRDQRYSTALGRLRPGVTAEAAEGELGAIAARLGREFPDTNAGWGVSVVPLHEQLTAGARSTLLVLLGASGLLLWIASGNVAILLFARGAARSHEVALRLALGAARGRVLRQGLVEAGLLAAAGGALGTALAAGVVAAMPWVWPDLPRVQEIGLDGLSVAFAVAAALAAALLGGALPAWRVARTDPRAAFGDGPRTTAARPAQAARDALVVAEVALTVVLLVAAGLVARSVTGLHAARPGFDARNVLVAPVFLDAQQYGSGAKSRAYYARLFERLRALPGIEAVGGATTLPTSPLGPDFQRPVWPAGRDGDPRATRQAWVRMMTPGYLDVLRIPVVAGRGFTDADAPGAPSVVAVSETLARALWPGETAVGKRLTADYGGVYAYEVVGVIGDVLFRGPRSEPLAEMYVPHAQRPYLILHVALRQAPSAPAVAADVRRVLREVDPQKPAHGVHRLEDLLGATFTRERRAMQVLAGFAGVACLLSGLGVYGMLAYRVRQRMPEIGVRLALGAGRARIVRWIAGEGVRLIARGVAFGVAGAALGARLLQDLLFGVAPTDPVTALGALGVLALLGALATVAPAWRATRVDPATVLRQG
jgi:predicted permease